MAVGSSVVAFGRCSAIHLPARCAGSTSECLTKPAPAPDSRYGEGLLLPARSDRLQQFGLACVSISVNGHNHHRQNFGVRVQGIELFIRADPIEHALANSQIERVKTSAIETPTQHLSEPFRARRPCVAAGLYHRGLSDNISTALYQCYSMPPDCAVNNPKILAHSRDLYCPAVISW